MKYPKDFINKIIQGDCLEVMKEMPDKSVGLVLTDPPYGIGADKGIGGYGSSKTDKHYEDDWDSKRPDKVIIFGGQFFTELLPANGHWIVWDKKGDIQFDNPFGDCELAWTNINKKSVKKFGSIIENYVDDNTVILDPYLGSGTTAVAAKQLGRKYIGIEISPKYCKIAEDRLRQEVLI